MVPGVPGLIMWGCWSTTCWQVLLPVWLPFEVSAVATGAAGCIDLLSQRNSLQIVGVRARNTASTEDTEGQYHGYEHQEAYDNQGTRADAAPLRCGVFGHHTCF